LKHLGINWVSETGYIGDVGVGDVVFFIVEEKMIVTWSMGSPSTVSVTVKSRKMDGLVLRFSIKAPLRIDFRQLYYRHVLYVRIWFRHKETHDVMQYQSLIDIHISYQTKPCDPHNERHLDMLYSSEEQSLWFGSGWTDSDEDKLMTMKILFRLKSWHCFL